MRPLALVSAIVVLLALAAGQVAFTGGGPKLALAASVADKDDGEGGEDGERKGKRTSDGGEGDEEQGDDEPGRGEDDEKQGEGAPKGDQDERGGDHPGPPAGPGTPAPGQPAPREDAPEEKHEQEGGEPRDEAPEGEEETPGAPAPAPEVGRSVGAQEESGRVRVRLPDAQGDVPLDEVATIPVGAVVDATAGAVRLTSAGEGRPSAVFRGGRFRVSQGAGRSPLTVLRLVGPLPECGRSSTARASRRAPARRRVWGSGHGRFRTSGRDGAATVRGTRWLTEDRCDGTRFVVREGVVAVRDHAKRKTVMVRAGESYLARRR